MSKISNVLTMIEYLSTGKKYSINELSQLLEVTPRMIRVYKNEIEKAPSFGYCASQGVYYYGSLVSTKKS